MATPEQDAPWIDKIESILEARLVHMLESSFSRANLHHMNVKERERERIERQLHVSLLLDMSQESQKEHDALNEELKEEQQPLGSNTWWNPYLQGAQKLQKSEQLAEAHHLVMDRWEFNLKALFAILCHHFY